MKYLTVFSFLLLAACGNNNSNKPTNDSVFTNSNAQDSLTIQKPDTVTPTPGRTPLLNDSSTNVSATGVNTALTNDSSKMKKKH